MNKLRTILANPALPVTIFAAVTSVRVALHGFDTLTVVLAASIGLVALVAMVVNRG